MDAEGVAATLTAAIIQGKIATLPEGRIREVNAHQHLATAAVVALYREVLAELQGATPQQSGD